MPSATASGSSMLIDWEFLSSNSPFGETMGAFSGISGIFGKDNLRAVLRRWPYPRLHDAKRSREGRRGEALPEILYLTSPPTQGTHERGGRRFRRRMRGHGRFRRPRSGPP